MATGTVTTCSGTFYDNGGSAAVYPSNTNIIETFTSSTGTCLIFTFSTFLTQTGNDILTIYDGPSTSSTVIGNYSGNISPGTIIASTSSITFKFVSNATGNKAGWAATISCGSCGTLYVLNNNSTINTCDGLFYDSGGVGGTYGNLENFTQTYCSNSSNCIQFTFYSMNLSAGDTLRIYDGASVAATLIGKYSGTVLPPTLLSLSGCLTFNIKTDASGNSAGWTAAISCTSCPSLPGSPANYTQPIVGLGGSYLGGPMVATCGGTYTDNGGTAGNYANGVTLQVYKTFCPASINTCLRANFFSVDLKNGDKLEIMNGPTMESTAFSTGSPLVNTNCSTYEACMALGYGPYLSSDQSGCISFIFNSNASANGAGWVATFDCIPCASGPNGTDNNDCDLITPICTNTGFSDASTGPGVAADVSDDCLITETYSNWYTFTISASGTLGMTIDPLSTGNTVPDDYDWALYGPNVSCGSLGEPIRCSTATTQNQTNNTGSMGNTGIGTASNNLYPGYSCASTNDFNETSCGNGWVNDLAVTTGQIYYLCVSKWSAGGSGFNLNWTLTGGAGIDCTILPIELTSFECHPQGNVITIDWTTASELNNDHFLLEKSYDGEHYETLATVPGKAFSSLPSNYFMLDNHPYPGNNYYRLSQTDKNGHAQQLKTTVCDVTISDEQVLMQVMNLSGHVLYAANLKNSEVENILHDLSLPAGMYITAIIYKNGMATISKFLKTE
ncbi:MAG: T9SS type A sorting domain-containing protein [Chitinophagaceae bacterium]|nr:T9SS type A sorting domain-containing protein [Chitinophagaceae bacterium]